MKLRLLTILAALLGIAPSQTAWADEALVLHEHPKFISVVTTYTMDDGLVVTWAARKNLKEPQNDEEFDPITYTVTLTQPAARKVTYSMLTLALQSVLHKVSMLAAKSSSGEVGFIKPGETSPTVPTIYPYDVQPASWKDGILDRDSIYFITFEGQICTLEVDAKSRFKMPETLWSGPMTRVGHDNTPPRGTAGN